MILEHDLLTNMRTATLLAGLPRTDRIIDVGCGIRPCPAFPCAEHVCIEPHDEYRAVLGGWAPPDRAVRIVSGPAELLGNEPRAGSTVLLLDVIEHMERDDGLRIKRLIEEFEHGVIFTPLGWYEQGDANPDAWGFNGGYWQKHRSAWQPEDFVGAGWQVHMWRRWYKNQPVGAILAIR